MSVAKKPNTTRLVKFSLLFAILALFSFTPLGNLPLFGGMVATLGMIPVIVAGLALGAKSGAVMGAFAGLFSLIVWTFMPPAPPLAFIFSPFYSLGEIRGNAGSLLICFVPRVATGFLAACAAEAADKLFPQKDVGGYAVAGALGSLANTAGYVLGVWVFFGAQLESMVGQSAIAILGATVLTNGLPEAAISALVAGAMCKPIKILAKRRKMNSQ